MYIYFDITFYDTIVSFISSFSLSKIFINGGSKQTASSPGGKCLSILLVLIYVLANSHLYRSPLVYIPVHSSQYSQADIRSLKFTARSPVHILSITI